MPSKVQWYGAKVQRQTMSGAQKGVNAVTEKIATVAAGNLTRGAGVNRGKLKRNIKSDRAKKVGSNVIGKAGPTKRAWYGKFLESGTAAHEIKPKNKKILAWPMQVGSQLSTGKSLYLSAKSGRIIKSSGHSAYVTKTGKAVKSTRRAVMEFARGVQHPGTQSTHFLTRALDTVWPEAPNIIAQAGNQAMSK